MHISRIVIRNFRNFRDIDIVVREGVTTFLGENNSGKSNLIYAVRLAVDASLSSFRRRLIPADFNINVDPRQPAQVLISLEFRDFAADSNEEATLSGCQVDSETARITYRFRPRRAVRDELDEGVRSSGTLSIDDYRWEIWGGGSVDPAKIEWDTEMSGTAFRFEDLQQSYIVVTLDALRDVEQSLRQSRSSPLTAMIEAARIPPEEQAALVEILSLANEQVAESETIGALGETMQASFAKTTGDAFAMGVRLGMVESSFTDLSRGLKVLLSDGNLRDFEPSRNGLGLNNVLFVSMILGSFLRRASEGQSGGQLLLIEEPEAHLHPQLQRVLFRALHDHGFQTFVTTHSTHVSSQAELRSTAILTPAGGGVSALSQMSNMSTLDSDEIDDLERYLDATRGALLFARKVMLVEGPAELYLIPPLLRAVKNVSLDEIGISVIPIFGTHFEVFVKLFGPNGLPKPCAVVTDGDAANDDVLQDTRAPAVERVRPLESDHVQVFACETTFERAITMRGTLPMLIAAARELGSTRGARKLEVLLSRIEVTDDSEQRAALLDIAGELVLRIACLHGKGRFAQVASKHVAKASALPKYIRSAVEWLQTWTT